MTIEVIYPELTNIYGDLANIRYLKSCVPNAKVIETSFYDKPSFLTKKIDMIYMGSMPDDYQEKIINQLLPYKQKIKDLIEENVVFLVTGTALEIFGEYILENDKKIDGLDIFKMHFVRDKEKRHNSLFLGQYNDIKIVGNQSRFTNMYSSENYFCDVHKGCYGMNSKSTKEGIHYNNFFGTYLLGPLLILNPLFTKYLLNILNIDTTLKYEKEVVASYNKRLRELESDEARYLLGDHG